MAFVNCIGAPVTGAWILASRKNPKLRLTDIEFRNAVALRLGLPMPALAERAGKAELGHASCPLKDCAKKGTNPWQLTDRGNHIFRCLCKPMRAHRNHRHFQLVYEIHRFFNSHKNAGMVVHHEPSLPAVGFQQRQEFVLPTSNKNKDRNWQVRNRGDIGIMMDGRYYVLDVVVSQPKLDKHHVSTPGKIVHDREEKKYQHYLRRYHMQKDHVIPIAIDTYGRIGQTALAFFDKAIKQLASTSKMTHAVLKRKLLETIGCTLVRNNSATITTFAEAYASYRNAMLFLQEPLGNPNVPDVEDDIHQDTPDEHVEF